MSNTTTAVPASPTPAINLAAQERKGMWLGLLGVAVFSLTLPMTRLAVGTPDAPQMSGLFVAMARATVAGILSAMLLWHQGAARPTPAQWRLLALTAMGVVFGLADRIAVVVYGQVIAFDTPEAIKANPKVQAAYLGEAHAEPAAGADTPVDALEA